MHRALTGLRLAGIGFVCLLGVSTAHADDYYFNVDVNDCGDYGVPTDVRVVIGGQTTVTRPTDIEGMVTFGPYTLSNSADHSVKIRIKGPAGQCSWYEFDFKAVWDTPSRPGEYLLTVDQGTSPPGFGSICNGPATLIPDYKCAGYSLYGATDNAAVFHTSLFD